MIQILRGLGTINGSTIEQIKSDLARIIQDIDGNFKTLGRQTPQTLDTVPAAGVIKFLAQEEDGSWHTWELIAGAGVTITPDTVNRTLTLTSP